MKRVLRGVGFAARLLRATRVDALCRPEVAWHAEHAD
jgi:hypothetical protein